jgi:hypothetical protein
MHIGVLAGHPAGRARAGAALLTPSGILAIGLAATVASVPAQALAPDSRVPINETQQLVATGAAILALLLAVRTASGSRRFAALSLAAAAAFVGLGMFIRDVQPGGWSEPTGPGDAFFAACVLTLALSMSRAIGGGLDRSRLAAIALDTSILLIASGTLLALAWDRVLGANGDHDSSMTALSSGLLAIAGPTAGYLALLHRQVRPRLNGPHAVLLGVTLAGLSMVAWQTLAARGLGSAVSPTDYSYSIGLLIAAYGGATWDLEASPAPRFVRLAQAATDLFPLAAVGLCVWFVLLVPAKGGFGVEAFGTAVVVVLALVRQVTLTRGERRARAAERQASARLEREIRAREMVLRSLARIEAADSPEETARLLCEEALRLDGVDHAGVRAFGAGGEAVVLGVAGLASGEVPAGTRLSRDRAEILIRNSAGGP